MKQVKFLLSLAVALLIVVPVLAQESSWTVSGDAKAVLNYSRDAFGDDNTDDRNSFTVDDVVINVNFNAAGEISPYIKMEYDKGDENRFWVGGSFKKGNFAGEANVKFDGSTDDVTIITPSSGATGTSSATIPGSSKEIDVDTAWVSYTAGAVEFKIDKGGVWSTDNTFKVTYTASDMLKVYVALSESAPEFDQIFSGLTGVPTSDDFQGLPLVNAGVNITTGIIAFGVDASYAKIQIEDVKQNESYGTDGFDFMEATATLTLTLAEGMSIKVFGGYGLNLDTYGDDSGYSDKYDWDELVEASVNSSGKIEFKDTVCMRAGVEAKAMGLTIAANYVSIQKDSDDNANLKMDASVAYDIKVAEMTLTPGVKYANVEGSEDTELDVTLTASTSF